MRRISGTRNRHLWVTTGVEPSNLNGIIPGETRLIRIVVNDDSTAVAIMPRTPAGHLGEINIAIGALWAGGGVTETWHFPTVEI